MQALQVSNVRSNFSAIVDTVIREKPVAVKRNRDFFMFISYTQILELVKDCKFKVSYMNEDDGSISATLDGFDLVVNGVDKETVDTELATGLLEYAETYFNDFQSFYNSTNRKQHFPYVLRILLSEDLNEIKGLIYA